MERDGVEVHKLVKTEQGQYQAILTDEAWSINADKGFMIWLSRKFFLRDTAGSPERAK